MQLAAADPSADARKFAISPWIVDIYARSSFVCGVTGAALGLQSSCGQRHQWARYGTAGSSP